MYIIYTYQQRMSVYLVQERLQAISEENDSCWLYGCLAIKQNQLRFSVYTTSQGQESHSSCSEHGLTNNFTSRLIKRVGFMCMMPTMHYLEISTTVLVQSGLWSVQLSQSSASYGIVIPFQFEQVTGYGYKVHYLFYSECTRINLRGYRILRKHAPDPHLK